MDQSPDTSTPRVHRHRARKEAGLVRLTVELERRALADRLISIGALDPLYGDDLARIDEALQAVLEDWLL